VERFAGMRQVVSYVGLDSVEHSSDNQNKRRRYGKISKQGDRMLRWLLVQSAVAATRHDPRLKRFYRRLLLRKGIALARVAAARKLLVYSWTLAILRVILAPFKRPHGRCRRGMSFFLLDTLPALRDGTLDQPRRHLRR
jgi:hypothetical protein